MCMAVLGLSMVDVELLLEIHRWHIKSAKVYYLFSIKICNNVFCIKRGTLTSMGTLLTGYLVYLVTLVAYFIQCFIVTIGTLRKCTMCIYGVMLFVYSEYTPNGFEKKTKLALTRDTYRALSITGQNESYSEQFPLQSLTRRSYIIPRAAIGGTSCIQVVFIARAMS